ncbi:hypothetical protein [Fusobacterium sp.]|uniref:hypothetical protein n=1 Tax=Fusobacterium sp. TaxID=68766 RepID=UPI0025BB41C3|nr:hypothetical protein [Fusobacterium sp.]
MSPKIQMIFFLIFNSIIFTLAFIIWKVKKNKYEKMRVYYFREIEKLLKDNENKDKILKEISRKNLGFLKNYYFSLISGKEIVYQNFDYRY